MIYTHAKLLLVTGLLVLGAFAASTTTARAQEYGKNSTAEDVAIAFFKTGATMPNLDSWARNSKDYKVAPPARAAEVLQTEKLRLLTKWQNYNPEQDLLDISTEVHVALHVTEAEDGNAQHWLHISFPQGDVTYFPYKFMDYQIALIPQQIEALMKQPIQKEQYDLFLTNFSGRANGKALLSLQLRTTKSYMQQPYPIDGNDFWTTLSDIVSMSLVSTRTRQPIWHYGAEWFVSPARQGLLDLYQ